MDLGIRRNNEYGINCHESPQKKLGHGTNAWIIRTGMPFGKGSALKALTAFGDCHAPHAPRKVSSNVGRK